MNNALMTGKHALMECALIDVLFGNVEIANMENVHMSNHTEIAEKTQIAKMKIGHV
jgi:hypothetical protein